MNAQIAHRTTRYLFGPLEVTMRDDAVCIGCGERTLAKIATLTPDELRAANSAAWKQLRQAERRCARFANVSQYGWGPHDAASQHADVALAVRKATWAALARLQGGSA